MFDPPACLVAEEHASVPGGCYGHSVSDGFPGLQRKASTRAFDFAMIHRSALPLHKILRWVPFGYASDDALLGFFASGWATRGRRQPVSTPALRVKVDEREHDWLHQR